MSTFCGFGKTNESQKELTHGRQIHHSKKSIAPGMSGRTRDLRSDPATFAHLYGTLCRPLPGASTHAACQDLCQWLAVGRGAQKRRIDCLSVWAKPPGAARLHRLGRLGRCTLAQGIAWPSGTAIGTRR